MKVYLGLGSNIGDRKRTLETAVRGLMKFAKPASVKTSFVYETPALLPPGAEPEWNKPFLNICVELETDLTPTELLTQTQSLEKQAGRIRHARWSPRELDIDILIYGDQTVKTDFLQLPHPGIGSRAFVLDPLKDLSPRFLSLARMHPQHTPIWMAILNITPDSFSDGGSFHEVRTVANELDILDRENIGILDIGGESTRPGATPLTSEQEWGRIKPVLEQVREKFRDRLLKPLVSVDTRHFETAVSAIELGADILNDVSGLADPRFVDLLCDSGRSYVLTHSLGIPADPKNSLPRDKDVVDELLGWFKFNLDFLSSKGVRKEQIILDPGIGFGKTALQSQIILQNIAALYQFDLPVLVGHSRKSFLAPFSSTSARDRDPESIGVSLAMIEKGVDILRVHNPVAHKRAAAGWNHVRSAHV